MIPRTNSKRNFNGTIFETAKVSKIQSMKLVKKKISKNTRVIVIKKEVSIKSVSERFWSKKTNCTIIKILFNVPYSVILNPEFFSDRLGLSFVSKM